MQKTKLYVIVYMIAIAAVFGAAVSGVQLAARSVLERNAELADRKALIQVFNLGDLDTFDSVGIVQTVAQQIDRSETRRDPETGWEFTLLKAYADPEQRQLTAYGFRFRGLGFWAPIEGILAISPGLDRTVGLIILAQNETPGLGGRITEPVFTNAFSKGLDVSSPTPGSQYVYVGSTTPQPGSPAYGRNVDAITGATQTSMAMERILNEHIARFRRAMDASDTTPGT